MDKRKIVITNNKTVYEKYGDKLDFDFNEDYTYRQILETVRTKIHEGYELLTHPLSGSVKPNETPYKSIMMSKVQGELDYQGLNIIEESIMTFDKFYENKATPDWTEHVLDDFRVIDDSLIGNVITKMI